MFKTKTPAVNFKLIFSFFFLLLFSPAVQRNYIATVAKAFRY